MATFRALRESNLALLRSVPRQEWDASYGVHDKRGRQTVVEFVRMEAGHDLNHLLQIERLLGRKTRRKHAAAQQGDGADERRRT